MVKNDNFIIMVIEATNGGVGILKKPSYLLSLFKI